MFEKRDDSSPPLGSQEFGLTKEPHAQSIHEVDEDLAKKAVRRMDYTVLPVMSMFYLLSFLVSTSGSLLTQFCSKMNTGSSRIELISVYLIPRWRGRSSADTLQETLALLGCRKTSKWRMHNTKSVLQCSSCQSMSILSSFFWLKTFFSARILLLNYLQTSSCAR